MENQFLSLGVGTPLIVHEEEIPNPVHSMTTQAEDECIAERKIMSSSRKSMPIKSGSRRSDGEAPVNLWTVGTIAATSTAAVAVVGSAVYSWTQSGPSSEARATVQDSHQLVHSPEVKSDLSSNTAPAVSPQLVKKEPTTKEDPTPSKSPATSTATSTAEDHSVNLKPDLPLTSQGPNPPPVSSGSSVSEGSFSEFEPIRDQPPGTLSIDEIKIVKDSLKLQKASGSIKVLGDRKVQDGQCEISDALTKSKVDFGKSVFVISTTCDGNAGVGAQALFQKFPQLGEVFKGWAAERKSFDENAVYKVIDGNVSLVIVCGDFRKNPEVSQLNHRIQVVNEVLSEFSQNLTRVYSAFGAGKGAPNAASKDDIWKQHVEYLSKGQARSEANYFIHLFSNEDHTAFLKATEDLSPKPLPTPTRTPTPPPTPPPAPAPTKSWTSTDFHIKNFPKTDYEGAKSIKELNTNEIGKSLPKNLILVSGVSVTDLVKGFESRKKESILVEGASNVSLQIDGGGQMGAFTSAVNLMEKELANKWSKAYIKLVKGKGKEIGMVRMPELEGKKSHFYLTHGPRVSGSSKSKIMKQDEFIHFQNALELSKDAFEEFKGCKDAPVIHFRCPISGGIFKPDSETVHQNNMDDVLGSAMREAAAYPKHLVVLTVDQSFLGIVKKDAFYTNKSGEWNSLSQPEAENVANVIGEFYQKQCLIEE